MRSPRRTLGATMLVLEALCVFFGALVAGRIGDLGMGRALGVFGTLAVALLLTAGLLRRPVGFVIGWLLQLLVLASGLLLPAMYLVGGAFALLWFAALRVGARVERERALHGGHGGPDDVQEPA